MRTGIVVEVTAADRDRLEAVVADRNSPQKHVWRAKIVLATADGLGTMAVMQATGKGKTAVWRWQERFCEAGVDGLLRDKTRPSRIKPFGPEVAERIVALTLSEPPGETTQWTGRAMAKAAGVSLSYVQRVWRLHGLQPHRIRTFKLSNDPHFAAKVRDIVGLYVDPPAHAVVLSVDEKSQIQALDRTQPGLPMKKGRAGTMTHDYKRNGTTTLFAALNVLTGLVIGQCLPRHRHDEFLRFLRAVDREVPADLAVHMILDNYGTHTHENVEAWLEKHPRFHLHFIPTSSSWLNLVERWFRELTDKAIRRGVFPSVPSLIAAIEDYLRANAADPKPFVWTATTEEILEKVRRGRAALDAITD
jgi:transposase